MLHMKENIIALKHQQFRALLEQEIRQGKYTLGSALPPERKLAEDYNISRQTVRQALKSMEDDGYLTREQGKGTFIAKQVSGGKAAPVNIGVAISGLDLEAQWFFPDLLRGISDAAAAAADATNIVLMPFDGNMPGIAEGDFCRRAVASKGLHGVLVATEGLSESEILYLMTADIPLVMTCLPPCPVDLIDYISYNHEYGIEQAVKYLVGLGHSRIAYVGAPHTSGYGALRMLMAFRGTMLQLGLPVNHQWVRECGFGSRDAEDISDDFLRSAEPPTAIVLADDVFAIGIYRVMSKKGLKIPEDLSLIGFNDMAVASALSPALTSIRVPRYEMGRLACEALIQKIYNPLSIDDGPGSYRQELDVELIIRDSCTLCTAKAVNTAAAVWSL